MPRRAGLSRMRQNSIATFALSSVIFGLIIRAIPEIWAGTHLTGFDTVLYAGELSRLKFCSPFLLPPGEFTLGLITCPLATIGGPILAMKVSIIFLYTLLASSIFFFSGAELRQPPGVAFFITVFVLLQVAALRLSWDLYRNLLGLSLLLITLTCLNVLSGRVKYIAVTILLVTIALTHQTVAGLLLLLLLSTFAWDTVNRRVGALAGLVLVLASILLTTVSVFFVFPTTLSAVTTAWHFAAGQIILTPLMLFLAALYLPAVFPALLGIRRSRFLAGWTSIIIAILLLIGVGIPLGANVYDRWSLMLFVPIGVFGALGLLSFMRFFVTSLNAHTSIARSHVKLIKGSVLLALLIPYGVLAWGFMTPAISRPYWYFDDPALWNAGASGLPSTMQQNTIAFSDEQYVISAFRWLNVAMNDGDVLLTHSAFYGWALMYLRSDLTIINYGTNLTQGMTQAESMGFSGEFVVWFVPGYGWHEPDPNFTGWRLVFQAGPIVIYDKYQSSHGLSTYEISRSATHSCIVSKDPIRNVRFLVAIIMPLQFVKVMTDHPTRA